MTSNAWQHGNGAPPVLLWVPRFWPAVGGTELHTRALADRLLPERRVAVLTHCDTGAVSHRSLAQDVCATVDATFTDEGLLINRLGLAAGDAVLSSWLADRYANSRLARAAFNRTFAHHLTSAASALVARAGLVHFVYNGLTDAAVLAANLAARCGRPFVFTPNVCDTTERATAWNSRRFRALYRSATRLIALTRHEAEWLVGQGADPDRIRVVPYGPLLQPDPDGSRARHGLGVGSAPMVLFLGRVVDIKGYDLLLGACTALRSRFPEVRIVFMGPATPASRTAIGAMRNAGVLLVEDADQRLKSDALAACDIMCLPSRAESLGVVYIEAACSARPVVTLDLPVLRGTVEHGRHGLCVAPTSAAVAAAVSELLADPARCRVMGEQAERDARVRFNWASVCEAVSAVYEEAVQDGVDEPRHRDAGAQPGQ